MVNLLPATTRNIQGRLWDFFKNNLTASFKVYQISKVLQDRILLDLGLSLVADGGVGREDSPETSVRRGQVSHSLCTAKCSTYHQSIS